jgi:virulence-associated protein VagC
MKTVDIRETSEGQTVPLPEEFHFSTRTVSIRREGEAVILEPVKPAHWPERFFDAIRIDDPAFVRPSQMQLCSEIRPLVDRLQGRSTSSSPPACASVLQQAGETEAVS